MPRCKDDEHGEQDDRRDSKKEVGRKYVILII